MNVAKYVSPSTVPTDHKYEFLLKWGTEGSGNGQLKLTMLPPLYLCSYFTLSSCRSCIPKCLSWTEVVQATGSFFCIFNEREGCHYHIITISKPYPPNELQRSQSLIINNDSATKNTTVQPRNVRLLCVSLIKPSACSLSHCRLKTISD